MICVDIIFKTLKKILCQNAVVSKGEKVTAFETHSVQVAITEIDTEIKMSSHPSS